MSVARLRWQCRRGMRELDVLLTRFLDESYPTADDAEKAAFARLLELSDPELIGYLLRGERADEAVLERVLAQLRGNAAS